MGTFDKGEIGSNDFARGWHSVKMLNLTGKVGLIPKHALNPPDATTFANTIYAHQHPLHRGLKRLIPNSTPNVIPPRRGKTKKSIWHQEG
jgi:hypothetical protein